jgi:hypothetical protein
MAALAAISSEPFIIRARFLFARLSHPARVPHFSPVLGEVGILTHNNRLFTSVILPPLHIPPQSGLPTRCTPTTRGYSCYLRRESAPAAIEGMPAPRKCPRCGFDPGPYAETHCPKCGSNFIPTPPRSLGIVLLDIAIAVCATFFVFVALYVFTSYMNTSPRAELYDGAPYRATTFRVTSVYYSESRDADNITHKQASAAGIVEGQKESMDLLPYIFPDDQQQLEQVFPQGTVIPVYLFPTLRGANRIQRFGGLPPAERYQRKVTWITNRALPVAAAIGMLTALLGFARFSLSRSRSSQALAAST